MATGEDDRRVVDIFGELQFYCLTPSVDASMTTPSHTASSSPWLVNLITSLFSLSIHKKPGYMYEANSFNSIMLHQMYVL